MKEMNEKDNEDKRPSMSSTDKLIVFYRLVICMNNKINGIVLGW